MWAAEFKNVPCIKTVSTTPHYTLVNVGRYPGLVEAGTTAVIGEVYAVDPKTLIALDKYEGAPDDYERRTVSLSDGTQAETYIFRLDVTELPVIPSGDWCNRK